MQNAIKWGAILLVVYLAYKWLTGASSPLTLLTGGGGGYTPGTAPPSYGGGVLIPNTGTGPSQNLSPVQQIASITPISASPIVGVPVNGSPLPSTNYSHIVQGPPLTWGGGSRLSNIKAVGPEPAGFVFSQGPTLNPVGPEPVVGPRGRLFPVAPNVPVTAQLAYMN